MPRGLGGENVEPRRPHNVRAALAYAVEHNNVEEVKALLQALPIDLTGSETETQRALSLAVSYGHAYIVELLLQRADVDPAIENVRRRTLLTTAVADGYVAIVKLLIENGGVDPNAVDIEGRTPLMWAVRKLGPKVEDVRSECLPDHWSTFRFLLNCDDIDVNVRDNHGRTALCHAAMIGTQRCVQSLVLHHSIQPHLADNDGRTALSFAAERGYPDITGMLIGLQLDEQFYLGLRDETGRTPLSWAVAFKPVDIYVPSRHQDFSYCGVLKVLLKYAEDGANRQLLESDYQDRSALSFAVENSWTEDGVLSEAVRLLLNSKTFQLDSMDREGRTILSRAAECGRVVVVEQLLQYEGVNFDVKDRDGRTPLSVAATNGHHSVVELIILARSRIGLHKIDMNSQDEGQHRTALHFAAECGHELVVKTLLTCRDVNTESVDMGGHTPLALAAMKNHRGVVALLTKGRSILQTLAAEGNLDYIHSLLKSGCDVDNRDAQGHTSLHAAALWNKSSIVKELLCWNPAINLKDVHGLTPLRIAINNRCEDIVTMLLHKSANPEAVMATEWFEVYGRRASLHLLLFSQNQSGDKSVNFVSRSVGRLELKPETDRHMV